MLNKVSIVIQSPCPLLSFFNETQAKFENDFTYDFTLKKNELF